MPGRRCVERTHLLHLPSQRLCRLADLRPRITEAAGSLGAAVIHSLGTVVPLIRRVSHGASASAVPSSGLNDVPHISL